MSSHRRTTSDSISNAVVFQPHPLSFAGSNTDTDDYHAAMRYDWSQAPTKLTGPRETYEPTQPFDYVLPAKKGRGKALSVRNEPDAEDGAARRKTGRLRREAQENHSPAVSVEPEGMDRPGPKRRGRPPRRAADTSRKTDDGDNSEDESYVQPSESWKAGTKRRASAPQHPPKRARTSRTVETDDEQETGPLRSGSARSRATPIKPQQANRWSTTEDRQLIDSLFEVLGSIPWRRVTAYMAEKGYSCADRGEGAIRGRWKVLRPRLYIAPPTVVRGAAAKSQLKARERAAEVELEVEDDVEEMDVDTTKDAEHEEEHEEPDRQQEHHEAEQQEHRGLDRQQEPVHKERKEVELGGEGDTTAEDDDVAAREEVARGRERSKRKVAPVPPPTFAPAPLPAAELTLSGPPTPPSIPLSLPGPTPGPGLGSVPAPTLAHVTAPRRTVTPDIPIPPRSPPPPFQHSTPNIQKEPRVYSTRSPFAPPLEHFSISPSRDPNSSMLLSSSRDQMPLSSTRDTMQLSSSRDQSNRDHMQHSPNRDHQLSPHRDPRQLSPSREAQTSPQSAHNLPTLSQLLSPPPAGHYATRSPPYVSRSPPTGHYGSHSPSHIPLPLSHQGMDARQLPLPQPFIPHSHSHSHSHSVWPARPNERTYEGERSYEREHEREWGYEGGSGSREYQVSGERGGGYGRHSYGASSSYEERPYVPPTREESGHERMTSSKSRKPLPEMLPFALPARHQPPPYQTYSTQVFSRLPVLSERTPSPRRKRKGKSSGMTSSQEEEVVPDSTAGSSDGL